MRSRLLRVLAPPAVAVAAAASVRGLVQHSVEIDAPIELVWAYGSDSTQARAWSVFFDHITPDEAPHAIPDGQVGAFRRCYRDPEELRQTWDETTTQVEPLALRRIHTYNLRGFPLGWIGRAQEYDVFQEYERIAADRTRLTFRSSLRRQQGVLSALAWPLVKATYVLLGRPAGQEVFEWNLANIKAAVEAQHSGAPYDRPFPWDPELACESRPVRWWIDNRIRAATQRASRRPVEPTSSGRSSRR